MSSCCAQLRDPDAPQLTLVKCVQQTARQASERALTNVATQVRETSERALVSLNSQMRAYAPAARSLLELALIATALLSLAFMT